MVVGVAGIEMYLEGKKVKKVEGVPPKPEQVVQDEEAIVAKTSTQKRVSKRKEKGGAEGQVDEKNITETILRPTSS